MKNIFNLLIILFFSLTFGQNVSAQLNAVKITFSEAKGAPGDIVCIDMKVDSFINIAGANFGLTWDDTKLEFVSINNTNPLLVPNGLSNAASGTNKQNFTYENSAAGGTTLPNGAVFFSICFKIKMPVGQSDNVIMTNSAIKIEFSNSNADVLPDTKIINKGLVQSVLPDLKPLKLIGSTETVKKGDTACVVFTVDDFTKIKKLEFDYNWDSSKLQFEYFSMVNTTFAVNGASTPFFVPFVPNSGKIEIRWDATKHAGKSDVTLPNGTVLFKICFKAIGDQGDIANIAVATVPAANVITTTSNNNNVGMTGTTGKVKILKTDFKPVEINISNYTGNANQDFCIDIKASNVDSMLGFQYSLQWDTEFLKFKEIKNLYPFPNNITLSFNTLSAVSSGFISSTLETTSAAFSLPPQTVLYQVCFTPNGLVGCDFIKMTGIPTPVMANNNQTQKDIGINATDGKICIESILKVGSTIVRPNCKDEFGGSVTTDASGGLGNYTYLWSSNAGSKTTPNIDKLKQGVYYVTISDGTNTVSVKFEVIGDTQKPKAKATTTGILECKAGSEVSLSGVGSSTGSNIKYQWQSQNGVIVGADSLLTAKCISASKYVLVVTDTNNGCVDTSSVVTVASPNVPDADAGANQFLSCTNVVGIGLNGCASKPTGSVSYKWSTQNGLFAGNSQTPSSCSILAKKAGTYILTVTNTTNGCTAVEKTEILADLNIPVAIATVKDSLNCDNSTVQLFGDESLNNAASNNGAGLQYTWSPISVGIVNNDNNAIATAEVGDKYVLTVKNIQGCLATDTIQVYDLRADTAFVKLPADIKLSCQGNKITIDGSQSSKGSAFVYKWEIANGSTGKIDGSDNTAIVTVSEQGKYKLTVTNKYSKCSAIGSVSVFAADVPLGVDAGKDTLLSCLVNKIQLLGKVATGPTYTFSWTTTNGGTITAATTINPTITKSGTYILKVTDTKNGCVSVDSVNITENKEAPEAKITGAQDFTCGVDLILLNGTSSKNADTYSWTALNGGEIGQGTEKTQTAAISKPGTYILKVTRNDNGCADSTKKIIKFQYPEKGYAGTDTLLCSPTPLTLTGTVIVGGSGIWTTLNDNFIEEKANNITEIDSLKTGKNTFIWTSSAPGCPDFAADTVVVFVEKAIRAKEDIIIQKNKSEYFAVPVTLNDDLKSIKSWKLTAIGKPEYGNLDTIATKTGFRYKPSDCYAGTQEFKYVVSSKNCPQYRDTAKVTLKITSDPSACNDVVIPNTITPNGDGLNDGFRIDAIEFQPERFKDAELTVFNRWGDVVYSKRPYKNEWQGTNQDGQNLPQATYYYILNLNIADGVVFRGDITILK